MSTTGINQRTWSGRHQPMSGWQHGVSSHCRKWWRRGHPLAVVLAHDPRPIPSRTASLVWYRMSYRSAPLVRYRPCLTEACSVWDGEGMWGDVSTKKLHSLQSLHISPIYVRIFHVIEESVSKKVSRLICFQRFSCLNVASWQCPWLNNQSTRG